ncbi:zinc ribbon domain-containing protein [Mycobacterium simiae]|uniref:Zinc ribbon domain-containing protein n=1 Tax=Mycobacterium simiae TaxID=1784 RepID=A0A5B1BXC5_MYCSI|nr:zinc ribbon domain-containing protein [Mycobacterium simiae]KAA1252033.1 zinc ribbon domain-containing protein [Mycobacterium simiae]
MPTYVFRCTQGCANFTERHPMNAIPDSAECPQCSHAARRIPATPMVGVGRSVAMRLHDRTRATADAPDVVTRLPAAQRTRSAVTRNPLHRRLPRA